MTTMSEVRMARKRLSLKRALLEGAGYEEFIIDAPDSMFQAPGKGLAYMSGSKSGGCGSDCDCDPCKEKHHHHDHADHADLDVKGGDEKEMVMSNLNRLVQFCQDLMEMMQDSDDIEEWVQEKIATSADRIEAVHGYISYEKGGNSSDHDDMAVFTLQEEVEEIEKSMRDEIKSQRYDDEMMKAGFSKSQSKRLPDELQKGILRGKKKG